MLEVILKRFDRPDEIRNFEKGEFETINHGSAVSLLVGVYLLIRR